MAKPLTPDTLCAINSGSRYIDRITFLEAEVFILATQLLLDMTEEGFELSSKATPSRQEGTEDRSR